MLYIILMLISHFILLLLMTYYLMCILYFELWCWRRLLRVFKETSRRSNQCILKEISPGCSLKGLMLKLKLQYFGHLMRRADSLEKTLMLGKIEDRRRRGRQRMRWLDSNKFKQFSYLSSKWVRQLIIHGTIISSINMVITRISRGISQLHPNNKGVFG